MTDSWLCRLAGHRPGREHDGERAWTVCRRCGHVTAATPMDDDERAYGSPRDMPRRTA